METACTYSDSLWKKTLAVENCAQQNIHKAMENRTSFGRVPSALNHIVKAARFY